MKKCIDCKKLLPLDDFYNAKRRRDGKCSYCCKCSHIRHTASTHLNREHYREYQRKYYLQHRGAVKKNEIKTRHNKTYADYLKDNKPTV
jgi:hypothetical protein